MTTNITSTTPATDILRRMDALQTKLAGLAAIEATLTDLLVCQQCKQPLRHYKQFSRFYGECTDRTCRRHAITLELNDLAALTDAQVDEFLAGKSA